MARIAILNGNHLCHNPRVMKEAGALSDAGHDVTILGAWFEPGLKERDQALLSRAPFSFVPVFDLTLSDVKTSLERAGIRGVFKAALLAHRVLGHESAALFGYSTGALRKAALRTPSDLYIAHSEAALAVAHALHQRSCRVGVDMEDWFSEDLLPEARASRPLRMLRETERSVLRASVHSTCPSHAMSEALSSEYGCRPPLAIYNAFPIAERQRIDGRRMDRQDAQASSIYWVSQTLGPGRGLKDLIAALPLLGRRVDVHLRGRAVPGFENWIRNQLPTDWRRFIFVHGLVPNDELASRIAEHDIGFAGEETYSRSRDLTVTNKILHYLCGGIPVVASATAGQKEVAALAPGAVFLYPPGDSRQLARQVDFLLSGDAVLAAAKEHALAAATRTLCWEKQVKGLVESVENAISAAPGDRAVLGY